MIEQSSQSHESGHMHRPPMQSPPAPPHSRSAAHFLSPRSTEHSSISRPVPDHVISNVEHVSTYTGRAGYCSERAAAVGFASTWSDPSLPDFSLLSESSRGQSPGWWTGVQPYTHTRTLTIVHGVLRCVFKPSLGRNQGRLGSTIGTSVVLRRAHAMPVYARPAHTDAFLRRVGGRDEKK